MRRITQTDIMRFTEGDCHILAYAINRITGWTVCAFNYNNKPDVHCFVKLPTGDFLDIEGICSAKEIKEKWQSHKIMKFEDKYKKVWGGPVFGSYSRKRANQLAEHLVSQVNAALTNRP